MVDQGDVWSTDILSSGRFINGRFVNGRLVNRRFVNGRLVKRTVRQEDSRSNIIKLYVRIDDLTFDWLHRWTQVVKIVEEESIGGRSNERTARDRRQIPDRQLLLRMGLLEKLFNHKSIT